MIFLGCFIFMVTQLPLGSCPFCVYEQNNCGPDDIVELGSDHTLSTQTHTLLTFLNPDLLTHTFKIILSKTWCRRKGYNT